MNGPGPYFIAGGIATNLLANFIFLPAIERRYRSIARRSCEQYVYPPAQAAAARTKPRERRVFAAPVIQPLRNGQTVWGLNLGLEY